jgi:hypothetical protein
LIEVVLPKQDVAVPRCLDGGEIGRVVPPPLDAKASSRPPCCQTFRRGSEISSCFGAPTPEFFATEASETKLGPAQTGLAPRRHAVFYQISFALPSPLFPPVIFDVFARASVRRGGKFAFPSPCVDSHSLLRNYYANPAISRAMVLSSPNRMSFPHSVGTSGSVHRPKPKGPSALTLVMRFSFVSLLVP